MNWMDRNVPMVTKHCFVLWLGTGFDGASRCYRRFSFFPTVTSAPAHTPDGVVANIRIYPQRCMVHGTAQPTRIQRWQSGLYSASLCLHRMMEWEERKEGSNSKSASILSSLPIIFSYSAQWEQPSVTKLG